MSAQTPQTDKLDARLNSEYSVPGTVPGTRCYEEMRFLCRAIERDFDHYKALCEKLKGALHGIYGEIAGIDAEDRTKAESNIVRRYLAVASGALKKAQKD
jgi:hypothetical protein